MLFVTFSLSELFVSCYSSAVVTTGFSCIFLLSLVGSRNTVFATTAVYGAGFRVV